MITKEIEQECMASLDRWMIALNAHDVDAMDKEMHFPHVRLAEGRLVVYERPGSNPMDLFNSLIQKSNWDHSAWTKRVPIQTSDSKVHWTVEYKRFTKDSTAIGTYESLYVMTLKEGKWKTQIRSSFGPPWRHLGGRFVPSSLPDFPQCMSPLLAHLGPSRTCTRRLL